MGKTTMKKILSGIFLVASMFTLSANTGEFTQ